LPVGLGLAEVTVSIHFQRVSKSKRYFDGQGGLWREQRVLRDLTFEVRDGEVFTILGPSGAGKSTLLRLVNRLEDPSQGQILLDGRPIASTEVTALRRKMGMVFQLPAFFPGTVRENVLYGPRLRWKKANLTGMAESCLAMVGLPADFLDRKIQNLSVGQQQRICLARALANEPSVLLLDEPTSALDLSATLALEEVICRLASRRNLTVLFVSHDLEQVRRVGQRTMLLIDGSMVELNETGQLFQQPRSRLTREFLAGLWKEEKHD
jgi:putative ABC transport system ATP-binding protein